MTHSPRPAGPVVLAIAPRGPHQAVAREDQQGLEPRVAAPGRPDRPHRRAGAPHPRGYAAVRGQVVVVREPPDVDRHRELRRGPRADAGHGEQARVGLVALEQRRRLGLEGPGLVEGLRYPGGQEPDLPVLGLDERRRGRGGGGRGLPGGLGPRAPGPGAGDPPRPAEAGEQLQPPPVRQVDRGLEGRAGLEQNRAQAVLVPGRAGDDVVALRREGAGGLEGLAAARDPRQGVRHAQGGPRDHRGVALVGLGLAGEQAGGAAGGEPGQVGDPEPRGAGPPHGEGPYVAELVDDERAGGRGGEQRVELGLPVADGGAGQHLPVAVDQAGPVR